MSSVWDLLNLRCLTTGHIQGELTVSQWSMSKVQGTLVEGRWNHTMITLVSTYFLYPQPYLSLHLSISHQVYLSSFLTGFSAFKLTSLEPMF